MIKVDLSLYTGRVRYLRGRSGWAWRWIARTDADVLHDLIVERGGAILSPLADGPFGRFFVTRDPDGYAITLIRRGADLRLRDRRRFLRDIRPLRHQLPIP